MQVVEILEGKQGQEVDMQELFARFTLDSIGGNAHDTHHPHDTRHTNQRHTDHACPRATEIAFGKKIGSLEKPVAFSLAFNQAQLLTDSRFQKFWWKAHCLPPPPPSLTTQP